MMKMNRNIMIGAAAFVAVMVIGGRTLAYFTDKDDVTNTFTVGDLDITETEPAWDDGTDGKNFFPGTTKYKNPTVKNVTSDRNGAEPGYVRMIVQVQDKDGKAVTDEEALALIWQTIRYDASFTNDKGSGTGLIEDRVPGYTEAEIKRFDMVNPIFVKDESRSTSNRYIWSYMGPDRDGVLDIGEEATLFTNVVIPTDWNQTQLARMGDFRLEITAEAIQCKGFATQAAAFMALDAEVAGGTIQTR